LLKVGLFIEWHCLCEGGISINSLFLASLVFATLLFVVPGELVLVMLSQAVPFVTPLKALIALNILVYALVLLGVRLARTVSGPFSQKPEVCRPALHSVGSSC